MSLALRPYVTAGVALVGASVIAVTPIAAPTPAIQSHAIQLSAAIENPVDVFTPVFDQANALLQTIITTETQNPTPVIQQWMKNQIESATILANFANTVGVSLGAIGEALPGVLQAAIDKSNGGDPAGALGDFVSGVMMPAAGILLGMGSVNGVFQRPVAVFQQLVSAAFTRPTNFLIAMLTAGVPAAQQVIRSTQAVFTAAGSGDPTAVINAIQHGIADIASAGITMGAAVYSQVNVIRTVLVRALKTRPPLLPPPASTAAQTAAALPAPSTIDPPSVQSNQHPASADLHRQITSTEPAPATGRETLPVETTAVSAALPGTQPADLSVKSTLHDVSVATSLESSPSKKAVTKALSALKDRISAATNKTGNDPKKTSTKKTDTASKTSTSSKAAAK